MNAEAYATIIAAALAFLATDILLKWWVVKGRELGLVGKDMNKPGNAVAVEAGGIWPSLSATFGILLYIAISSYFEANESNLAKFSITQVLLLAAFLGFIDDILGWKKGISPLKRVAFTIPVVLPLVAVKAGYSVIELPLLGPLDLGPLYPLLAVPIGVLGASNAFNMIAGYNGLEATQAILLSVFAAAFMAKKGIYELIPLVIIMIAALLAFLRYNKYPAKAFPGNTFTYSFGAFFASLVIYGNFEKFGLTLFLLYFIELLLFLRGLLHGIYKENFGIPREDGTLLPPYDKCYSITHVALKALIKLKGSAREVEVVYFIAILQAVIGAAALLLL